MIVPYIHLAMGQGFLALAGLTDMLATFTRSDVVPGAVYPFWYRWATVQGTHALIGVVLVLRCLATTKPDAMRNKSKLDRKILLKPMAQENSICRGGKSPDCRRR